MAETLAYSSFWGKKKGIGKEARKGNNLFLVNFFFFFFFFFPFHLQHTCLTGVKMGAVFVEVLGASAYRSD